MNSDISLKEPIVSVEWLHEHLSTENLVVLDGTINKVFDASQKQIPNTRLFDIKNKFSDASNPFPSAFPSIEQFQKEARNLGINKNSTIVISDDKGIYSSARVWWLFKSFGYNNVAVLNGGFPAWLKADYQTEPMKLYNGEVGDFTAKLQPDYMKFFNDIVVASKNKTHTIVDARSANRFKSLEPEPRAGLRMGTIPNSVNLPFEDLLDNGILKPKVDLEKAFYMVADKNDDVIFSCGSGITACVLALGAEISGYKNISVYDGSWTEWGSLVTSNMETPSTWTKDELLAYILLFVAHSDLNETQNEKEYILSRVDKNVFERVHKQFENDNDYQSIQNIIEAVKTHDYYRNDLADLFADIKLMAFADGGMDNMEKMAYSHLKKILK
ncbi:3-mercaptopyruvate sulfurtransferase SseA, contains two rhodanese domains [Flaviramulus basaltis]|uniref:3-mercaptopyruvate sulfurtransferase SseA, contains two rhodanese domains n=1 Tax=Flaviramulus basaltis TaxID=369401 RepID=A0A1K2IJE6_9FLAO|nr:sulfurtransferase [Flaviramulus basaltis]SFZ91787.1 3-mercaptopyruvate sulfurtransferase SseA, contains two rhodanese domains [Flaviramulus basaltis]